MNDSQILDIKKGAFEEVVRRVNKGAAPGGNVSTTPVYSRLRVLANLRTGTSLFKATLAPDAQEDLKAFQYELGQDAAAGGYGSVTKATRRHTNVTKAGEVPNGGAAFVAGFMVSLVAIVKPGTVDTSDNAVSDRDNSATLLGAEKFSTAAKVLLDMLSDAFVPYVQRNGGRKEYLGRLQFAPGVTDPLRAVVVFPEGWMWNKGETLVFGLERRVDRKLPAAAAAASFISLMAGGIDVTPADGADAYIAIDLEVATIGGRSEPLAT